MTKTRYQIHGHTAAFLFRTFGNSNLEFVSDFGFRASNLIAFVTTAQKGPLLSSVVLEEA